jgi:hypothetical protein
VLGLLAFLVSTLVYPRRALRNVTYMLALASWGLVGVRAFLLGLIDATSFPALQLFYICPVYFLMVAGTVLSLAAFLQLAGFAPKPDGSGKVVFPQ